MSTTTLQKGSGKKEIRAHLEGPEFRDAVAKALPRHLPPDRFIRIALTAMTRTPKLAQCDPASFFQCLLSLSQFGLEPDGRRAHLIPFENKKRNVVECQLIIDYKGLAELAMRSGVVSYLHADVVCDNDEFEYDRGEVKRHKIDFKKPRGKVYAAYALCRFKDGGESATVMSRDDVEAIRKRSRAAGAGPWVTDWDEMAKKTAFRRLSKWLPLSPEFRDALDADVDEQEQSRFEAAKPVFEVASTAGTHSLFAPVEEAPDDSGNDASAEAPLIPPDQRATPLQGVRNLLITSKVSETTLEQYLAASGMTNEGTKLDQVDEGVLTQVIAFFPNVVGGLQKGGAQ